MWSRTNPSRLTKDKFWLIAQAIFDKHQQEVIGSAEKSEDEVIMMR